MDKLTLLEKVKSGKYSQEQLIGWINALPSNTIKCKPVEYKAGDVFMNVVFKHPYVLLKKRKRFSNLLCNKIMRDLLKKSREEFKKGDLFYSASGLLSSPLVVGSLRISENYPNMVINGENGGIIAILEEDGEIVWAKKV